MIDLSIAGPDSPSVFQSLGDADASILTTTRRMTLDATLTAVRTVMLPSSVQVGRALLALAIPAGAIPAANGMILARNSSTADTIHGFTAISVLGFGMIWLSSNGSGAWTTTRLPAVSREVTVQEDVISSSLTNSSALSLWVGPGKYKVRCKTGIYDSNTAAGVNSDMTFSGTATYLAPLHYVKAWQSNATALTSAQMQGTAALSMISPISSFGDSTGSAVYDREFVMTVTSGGILTFRFARSGGTTGTASLAVGSYLQVEPIR